MAIKEWIWKETAEILGVLAVFGSLIFVAFEIRQNTQVSQAASIQAMADASIQVITAMNADEQLAGLMTRLFDGSVPSDFTPVENTRLRLILVSALRASESRYRQIKLGVLPQAQAWLGGAAEIYRTPYFRESWSLYRTILAGDYADFMESEYEL